MSVKFKLKPLAIAMMPLLVSGAATSVYAQEVSQKVEEQISVAEKKAKAKKEKEQIEVIEVSGYRGSIQRSINSKRLADGVSDGIFAEDIGKSTDQNIADALSRITGVTVQESDGEGTRISVRGAGANLNQISLNGVALTSSLNGAGEGGGTSDQSVDLSTFSSDILSSINVIKTSAADHDEGSLGANVILRTVKPLLVDEDKRILEVQGRLNEFADEDDYKISGTFSEKMLDDTLGIIVTASKETSSSRRDEIGSNWLAPYEVQEVKAGRATDAVTGEPITEDQYGFMPASVSYNAHLNNRVRETITAGIQWLPTDVTDVQLDLSYSKQEYNADRHSIGTSRPGLEKEENQNFTSETTRTIGPGSTDVLVGADPQVDWWTINTQNHTFTKTLNRYGTGALGRSIGGNQTENKVATLKINHEITEDLSVELTTGWSKTDFESLPNWTINTDNWKTLNARKALDKVSPEDIVPVGYDCTSGECIIVTGDTPFVFIPSGNGNGNDNISNSGFNPYDGNQHHAGYVAQYNQTSYDENKSLFLDFDWAVDFAGLTSVEFGGKVSNRHKVVYTDRQQFSSSVDTVFDDRGNVISGQSASDIRLIDMIGGTGIPVDDFMGSLVGTNSNYNQNYLNGWGIIDPVRATNAIFGLPNIEAKHNNDGDRDLEQDNVSLYGKLNFEYFEGKLTGNVGVRYVKTKNNSFGYSSMGFNNGHGVISAYDLVYERQIYNNKLNLCPAHTAVGTNDTLLSQPWENPADSACFDNEIEYDWGAPANTGWKLDESFATTYDDNGNVTQEPGNMTRNNQGNKSWWANYRYWDTSTAKNEASLLVDKGIIEEEQDAWSRQFSGTGKGKSSLLLPSLNLNYALDEDTIIRFATSKTMARPAFDSLKPGFSVSESVWNRAANKITKTNPDLKPLESTNIDLSYEWYFNKSGMVSLAYFRKDMKNFEEQVTGEVFIKDIRRNYDLEAIDWEDFRILPGEYNTVVNQFDGSESVQNTVNTTNTDCLPYRTAQGGFNNPYDFNCASFTASVTRNGKKTETQGVEFSYNQTYDFLPGIWSGLGVNFNYTFANSESEAEFSEELQKELKALPQAYTPRHSTNTTLYWEQDGHQMRLTHRYNDDQLVNREVHNGATWKDASTKLDFSATYQWDKNVSFSFHALNLTDELHRTYYTSTSADLGMTDADGNTVLFDEGNALKDDVDTSRTVNAYKTGRQYRLSARINF